MYLRNGSTISLLWESCPVIQRKIHLTLGQHRFERLKRGVCLFSLSLTPLPALPPPSLPPSLPPFFPLGGVADKAPGRWFLLKLTLSASLLALCFWRGFCPGLNTLNSSYICHAWEAAVCSIGGEQAVSRHPPAWGPGN